MIPNTCPDGLDCPNYHWCDEFCHDDDTCPLIPDWDHDVPIDKIITDA